MSAPCIASASPLPCQRSPPSSSSELPGAGLGAQAVDQRLQMGKAAELAVAVRGLGEVEVGEGVRIAAVRRDAEMLEERFADQMRRLPGHWRRRRD